MATGAETQVARARSNPFVSKLLSATNRPDAAPIMTQATTTIDCTRINAPATAAVKPSVAQTLNGPAVPGPGQTAVLVEDSPIKGGNAFRAESVAAPAKSVIETSAIFCRTTSALCNCAAGKV